LLRFAPACKFDLARQLFWRIREVGHAASNPFRHQVSAVFAGAIALPVAAQPDQASTRPPSEAIDTPSAERIADLIRLWTYVRFFDVDPRAMTREWENALSDAAKPALEGRDDAALNAVAMRMLAHIDPPAPNNAATSATERDGPAFAVVHGHTITSCVAIAKAAAAHAPVDGGSEAFAAAAKRGGLIYDCRGFPAGDEGGQLGWYFTQWLPGAVGKYLAKPIDRGAIKLRFHDGYPPDEGGTSGQYSRGTIDQAFGQLSASRSGAVPPMHFVFLADASSPDLSGIAGGLQAAGLARLLAQGPLANDYLAPFTSKHVHALVRIGEYVSPSGRVGFRPDGCLSMKASDATVIRAAEAALHGGRTPACAAAARKIAPPVRLPDPAAGEASVPSLGERMVALAKLWGTFEYFHPYKDLNDRPWENELEEFMPIFAAADSRAAYEDAVQHLAARADDSHVGVTGLKASRFAGSSTVPIYVVPVEGGFAVGGLNDPALATQVQVGDEIVAVDGEPAKAVAAALAPTIATSTPQWLAQMQAGFLLRGPKGSSARLTLRRGNGPPFNVVVARSVPYTPRPQPKTPSFHRIGRDIGYVDLERLAPADANRAIDELLDTRAIVFDLRGYPQGTGWTIAARLALPSREQSVNALFRRPIYVGPAEPQEEWKSFSQRLPRSDKAHYRGKVIVLIDARAVSQSEHTAMLFEAAANPIFVGTPTAGANGDVTNVELPGELFVRFTGHDVRHADGRQLQRVGIQPTVVVAPTFKGMQDGRDEILEAGLAIARQP
jgi:C-terminal processing protease CtpA/Prc